MNDMVNHPPHYTQHPSGVECIEITRHMGFVLGNAFKYCFRSTLKHDDGGVEDLRKSLWYIKDAISRSVNGLNCGTDSQEIPERVKLFFKYEKCPILIAIWEAHESCSLYNLSDAQYNLIDEIKKRTGGNEN